MRRLRFRPWCNLLLFILPLVAVGPAARVLAAAPENRAATDVQPAPGGSGFDVAAATAAYLAKVPLEQRQRSDAYFEGGYWLILWDFLGGAAVLWFLLASRWSAAMRDRAERLTRLKSLQAALYWAQFILVQSVLLSPLAVYEGYFREHTYHLSTQTFGLWLKDQVTILAVNVVLGAILFPILYGVLRRVRSWWLWGALVATVFVMFVQLIAPVFLFPLLNRYTRLEDESIRGPILSLARANGISAADVYVFDASRQTTRVSANVSGFLGTQRISLNDNMLKRCSLPEIEAAMGHEMGHFALHHPYEGSALTGMVIVAGLAFLRRSFDGVLRRFGSRWRVSGVGDLAGLPLLLLLFSVYLFALTPVTNSFTRTLEAEADLFGLNAAGQPDGAAEVALKLGEYRKLDPGPLEEIIFFDHPSGRSRIFTAMRWKAEQLNRAERRASSAR